MKSKVKKIWNYINNVLLCLVLILVIALVGVRLVGIDIYIVFSGSMEPVYMTGSVIYVKKVNTQELKVSDDITFRLKNGTIATHRIVGVIEDEGQIAFKTKGIANKQEDAEPVLATNVIGKPIFTIPYLGYLAQYIQSTSGRYATIALGATLLLLIYLPDIIFYEDKKTKEKTE